MSAARMMLALCIVGLLLAACSPRGYSPDPGGSWVGTITSEGDVTTVVNEKGSVWGGPGRLVEVASIGVSSGPDEYMLGRIGAVYQTDDEIYILDKSVAKVRVYDLAGTHLRSFGRRGQGPGELGSLLFDVTVDADGRIFVGDRTNRRINIYSAEGEPIDQIPLPGQVTCCVARLVLTDEGGMWMHVRASEPVSGTWREGVRVHTLTGPVGPTRWIPDLKYDRRVVRVSGAPANELEVVPFAARRVWTFGYDETLVVGTSDRYEFQMIGPNGSKTVVSRYWEPAPVTEDEVDYWRRMTTAALSWAEDLNWDGKNIPDHKPAYRAILPSTSGEWWLVREGFVAPSACTATPSEMLRVLETDPYAYPECLFGEMIIDVFDRAGRYLGTVDDFPFRHLNASIRGDSVVGVVEDDSGTVMVKRFRLLPPVQPSR